MTTYVSKGRNYTMTAHIFDSRIDHMAAEWVDGKAKETARLARVNLITSKAVRTGDLLRSVNKRRRHTVGGHTTVTVTAGAGHAAFVHQGTVGPITGKMHTFRYDPAHRGLLWVPRARGSADRRWRVSVAGQRANPFLSAAMQEALIGTRAPFRLPF